jgi:predicted glycoside hydrolase/deacetylase ChbG (UPF0249 family)
MAISRSSAILNELGFDPHDRVVIVHADDVGMCQATLPAFAELLDFGLVTSGSVMVPCPWFLEAARWYSAQPNVDLGIHLTLTSEWPTYRWGPLSTRDMASGLLDNQGFFHPRRQSVVEHSSRDAVRAEMSAQVQAAKDAGIDVTHLDCHMYVGVDPKFLPDYIDLCITRWLPGVISRDWWESSNVAEVERGLSQWEERGYPVFEKISVMGVLDRAADRVTQAKREFDAFPPGLSCLLIHPAVDTPELRAITPDWKLRVADYQVFSSPELREHLRRTGIQMIGYQALRRAMRSNGISYSAAANQPDLCDRASTSEP